MGAKGVQRGPMEKTARREQKVRGGKVNEGRTSKSQEGMVLMLTMGKKGVEPAEMKLDELFDGKAKQLNGKEKMGAF